MLEVVWDWDLEKALPEVDLGEPSVVADLLVEVLGQGDGVAISGGEVVDPPVVHSHSAIAPSAILALLGHHYEIGCHIGDLGPHYDAGLQEGGEFLLAGLLLHR